MVGGAGGILYFKSEEGRVWMEWRMIQKRRGGDLGTPSLMELPVDSSETSQPINELCAPTSRYKTG
jgi:hypothetical protein